MAAAAETKGPSPVPDTPSIPIWDTWDWELPAASSDNKEYKEYHALNNETFQRQLSQEIRANFFKKAASAFTAPSGVAVALMGGTSADFELYDTDVEKCPFRQESFFRYLFGINEPDCYGVLDLATQESLLFVPFCSDDAERWNGERRELKYYSDRYGVTHAFWTRDLHKTLGERKITTLHTLMGVNADSGSKVTTTCTFPEIKEYKVDSTVLYDLLSEQRVFKTPRELELMRLAVLISSQAHVYVMRHIKAGMTEMQCEALFKAWCNYFGAARHAAYTCICGSGPHGAILHYGHAGRPNDRLLADGDTVVFDMGAEYTGYATDVTRGMPVSGVFTPKQRVVHTAVYEAQQAVMQAMRPGVFWPDMHRLAERVILQHLLKAGILKDGTIEEMEAAYIGSVFMPHGLGHLLGLATHDCGGHPDPSARSKEPGLCWLRCTRLLEENMVITVEPGVYFNDKWLDRALANPTQAKFINAAVLAEYRGSGGCRLEDDVVVTATGCRNLTVLPTSCEEIEHVIGASRRARAAAAATATTAPPATAAAATATTVAAAGATATTTPAAAATATTTATVTA